MVERRLTWLSAIVILWGAAVWCKLVSLQVVHHREYAQRARSRQVMQVEIPAPRGSIFDREGRLLAMSAPTESVSVNPLKLPNLEVASELLARSLHLDRADLYGRMKAAFDNHRGYLLVKRRMAFDEGRNLRDMQLEWVDIKSESQRHYPNGTLAAHVLGGVDFSETGNAGVEKTLDPVLRGKPGEALVLTDVKRRGIDQHLATEARPGLAVTLTIDERLQFLAERELAAGAVLRNAVSGSIVVMNPRTGEILALASWPAYDPNLPPLPGDDPDARRNHAISVPFEPGSVFKVMTLSTALETTGLRPESPIDCGRGTITLYGRTIHEAHGGFGVISMAMVLARSSNVGAIRIGLQVGRENLYEYDRRFGFGQHSGIQLPGESSGKLNKLSKWGSTSLASISMGQEVSVTTIQLARAASVIANGGLLVKPRLVMKIGDKPVPVEAPVRIIRPETALEMRKMMEGVVLPGGTAYPEARLAGYTVGGKTGSAQIFDYATRHYTHNYNGTFMGFAPLTNPSMVVVVTLNGTHGSGGYGGRAAAPVFHAVASEVLRILDIPKDLPDEPEPLLQSANADDGEDDVAIAGLDPDRLNILEEPEDDQPAQPAANPDGGPVAAKPAGPSVPNFGGMTMRAVLARAAANGWSVLPEGSGTVRGQDPPPGAALHPGERIRVRFQ